MMNITTFEEFKQSIIILLSTKPCFHTLINESEIYNKILYCKKLIRMSNPCKLRFEVFFKERIEFCKIFNLKQDTKDRCLVLEIKLIQNIPKVEIFNQEEKIICTLKNYIMKIHNLNTVEEIDYLIQKIRFQIDA